MSDEWNGLALQSARYSQLVVATAWGLLRLLDTGRRREVSHVPRACRSTGLRSSATSTAAPPSAVRAPHRSGPGGSFNNSLTRLATAASSLAGDHVARGAVEHGIRAPRKSPAMTANRWLRPPGRRCPNPPRPSPGCGYGTAWRRHVTCRVVHGQDSRNGPLSTRRCRRPRSPQPVCPAGTVGAASHDEQRGIWNLLLDPGKGPDPGCPDFAA